MIDDATESLIMQDDQGDSKAKPNGQGRYGWRNFTPGFLQFMNQPKWALVVISGVSMNQGIVINGLLHLMVPHIERRFELSSTEASIVINAYDIGSLILLMPITYLGSRRGAHRPRFIGHGAIIIGTGSLVFSLPAFITGPYFSEVINNLCQDNPPIIDKEPIPYGWLLYGLLFFGNFLHGIGAVPLSTLSLTYLDDAVPNTKTSLYIGVFYGMAIVGPAIGAGVGGLFSHYLDVDFLRHITIREDEVLTPDNPRWVGCWWLGFVIFGIIFYPLGSLVLGFPRILPGTKELIELKKIKSREDYTAASGIQVPEIKSFKSLPSLLWFVVQNIRFDLITVAGTCELFLLQALGTHFPKLLQQQFNLQPLMVSICLGTVTVPPCLIGLCIGGYIMRVYQLELKATLFFCACLGAVGTLIISGIMLHCPNQDFDGIQRVSQDHDSTTDSYLDKPCNKNCNCDKTLFDPVCGYNNVTYYSACFAGCEKEERKFYYDCRCISPNLTDSHGFQAKYGPCPRDCYLLYVMLAGVFIYQVISFMAGVPAITASLRCNDQEFRSLALAVQWMCFRLFGAIPGPIVLGNAVDSSCIHWNYAKGVRGACLVYDHWKLGWLTALTCVSAKFIETVAFAGAFLLERRRLKKIAIIRSQSGMTNKLSTEHSGISQVSAKR